jgi:GNAT superfamily N-acetyltransferase
VAFVSPRATVLVEPLPNDALSRIAEIDRSETVRTLYTQRGTELVPRAVNEEVPDFFAEGESHSIPSLVAEWQPDLDAGGVLIGAFVDGALAGIAMLGIEVEEAVPQLALLFVSRPHRRMGVGDALLGEIEHLARERGARALYVSAVPSDSAVGFYASRGFRPVEPLPGPFAKEPEDVHMLLAFGDDGRDARA